MHLFSLLVLAFAVSLDSFSVGTTYGLRKMNIPFLSIVIISGCSAFALLLSMSIGEAIEFISQKEVSQIGGWILIVIGLWALFQFFRPDREKRDAPRYLVNLKLKKLGIVIQIFRKPVAADIDQSGTISGTEAILLGMALSFDAFGAGIGVAFMGYSPILTAFTVACMSALFLWAGKSFGHCFSEVKWIKNASFIPGVILILLGIWKM